MGENFRLNLHALGMLLTRRICVAVYLCATHLHKGIPFISLFKNTLQKLYPLASWIQDLNNCTATPMAALWHPSSCI